MRRQQVTIPPVPWRDKVERHLQQSVLFSPGLEFDRFFPCWTENRDGAILQDKPVSKSLEKFCARYNSLAGQEEYKQLLALNHARLDMLVNEQHGITLRARNETPLVIGLGIDHPTENGFCFDRNNGAVFLPGSGIKGLCRAWAKDLGLEASARDLFGYTENTRSAVGRVRFLPALPGRWPTLKTEVICNHHQNYYSAVPEDRHYFIGEANLPLDTESPVPIFHLAVVAGCEFVFRLLPGATGSGKELDLAAQLLAEGLQYLGMGARTAVGHGRMVVNAEDLPEPVEILRKKESIVPGVIKTFISYSRADSEAVRKFLDQGSRLGVFPWLDINDLQPLAGAGLPATLQKVMQESNVRTVTLFLSRSSRDADWVKQEMEWAREMKKRVIPVLLDEEEETRKRLEQWLEPDDPLFLRPGEPGAPLTWMRTIARCHDLEQAETVVLYLAHREGRAAPLLLPDKWKEQHPVLVLGNGGCWQDENMEARKWFPDSEEEYQEIEAATARLRDMVQANNICIAGLAPMGVAGLVGKHWDRATGKNLTTWNSYAKEEWTVKRDKPGTGSPETWNHLKATAGIKEPGSGQAVMLGHFSNQDQYQDALRWVREEGNQLGIAKGIMLEFPQNITGDMAPELAIECAQSFSWCKSHYRTDRIYWFAGLPLALMPLVTYLGRATAHITFMDFDLANRRYIPAFTLT